MIFVIINIKVFRNNRIIDFKLTPKINSFNEKIIGVSLSRKCPRSLDDQGIKIDFYQDQFYHECSFKKELASSIDRYIKDKLTIV